MRASGSMQPSDRRLSCVGDRKAPPAVAGQCADGVAIRDDRTGPRSPLRPREIETGLERVGAGHVGCREIRPRVRIVARRVRRADPPVVVLDQLDIVGSGRQGQRACCGWVGIGDANGQGIGQIVGRDRPSPRFLVVPEPRLEEQPAAHRRRPLKQLIREREEVRVVQPFVRRRRRAVSRPSHLVVVVRADLVLRGDLPGKTQRLLLEISPSSERGRKRLGLVRASRSSSCC